MSSETGGGVVDLQVIIEPAGFDGVSDDESVVITMSGTQFVALTYAIANKVSEGELIRSNLADEIDDFFNAVIEEYDMDRCVTGTCDSFGEDVLHEGEDYEDDGFPHFDDDPWGDSLFFDDDEDDITDEELDDLNFDEYPHPFGGC